AFTQLRILPTLVPRSFFAKTCFISSSERVLASPTSVMSSACSACTTSCQFGIFASCSASAVVSMGRVPRSELGKLRRLRRALMDATEREH
ncbi:MAG: hypothetical protein SGPRY_014018, partial [Prymnesium sp.]